MFNIDQDWRKMPQPKTKPKAKATPKENRQPKREGEHMKEPTGKDGLGDKGALKAWLESTGKSPSNVFEGI